MIGRYFDDFFYDIYYPFGYGRKRRAAHRPAATAEDMMMGPGSTNEVRPGGRRIKRDLEMDELRTLLKRSDYSDYPEYPAYDEDYSYYNEEEPYYPDEGNDLAEEIAEEIAEVIILSSVLYVYCDFWCQTFDINLSWGDLLRKM